MMLILAFALLKYITITQIMATCTYSVILYDKFGDGWGKNNMSVFGNDSPLLDEISLNTGTSSPAYNFDVASDVNIVSSFKSDGSFSQGISYSIFSGAGGTGRPIYSSIPYFQTVSNPCDTELCNFSVAISRSKETTSFGSCALYVFIDKVAVILNQTITTASIPSTLNLNVASDNIIQVYFRFEYTGGEFPYHYSLYSKADGKGYSFFTSENIEFSPQSPVSIPNFCEESNLSLSIPKLTYKFNSKQVLVSVVPSLVPPSSIGSLLQFW